MGSFSFTEEAERDLEAIIDHTREEWGSGQAGEYLGGLEERLFLLADNPRMGSERGEIASGLFSFPYESHMIY